MHLPVSRWHSAACLGALPVEGLPREGEHRRVAFEAEVEPETVIVCHCTDCQTLSGSSFRTVVPTVQGSFRLLKGTPRVYVKTGESGNPREQSFCPNCGTPIYSGPVGPDPRVLGLRVGALTQRDVLVPRVQFWHRSAQHWLEGLSGVKALATQLVFGPGGAIGVEG